MVALRCTKRLLQRLRIEAADSVGHPGNALGHSYANVVTINRALFVLAISERSLPSGRQGSDVVELGPMELVRRIKRAWGWIGIEPSEVVGENDFGNLMVRDVGGRYWRLCPEDLSCKVVAENRAELDTLSTSQAFLHDWYASTLVNQARDIVGPLSPGRKYCPKIPGPLGGEYGGSNLGSISLAELIDISGDIARQIEALPDGSKIHLKVIE